MYKEECVLKNKIFHPSVMYYILSTIVYPLSLTYPMKKKKLSHSLASLLIKIFCY